MSQEQPSAQLNSLPIATMPVGDRDGVMEETVVESGAEGDEIDVSLI